jgi:hypothetical protein
MASFIPTGVALFKMAIVLVAQPREMRGKANMRRPLLLIVVQVTFTLLNAAASIFTLMKTVQR